MIRITNDEAKRLGLTAKAPKRRRAKVNATAQRAAFIAACLAWGLPKPLPEFRWHRSRKFRFDWAWPHELGPCGAGVAVEIIGGVWNRGHHSRGQDQIDDMLKRNEAQIAGWIVLEFTPQQIASGECFPVIRRALELD